MLKRFVIRDDETKKIKRNALFPLDFRSLNAAIIYMSSSPFGVANFWEIYDRREEEIVYNYKKGQIVYRKKKSPMNDLNKF